MGVEPEVDMVRIVGDVDLRRLSGGGSIEWLLLGEFGDMSGSDPYLVVQDAIDDRCCVCPCRGDPRSIRKKTEGFRGQ